MIDHRGAPRPACLDSAWTRFRGPETPGNQEGTDQRKTPEAQKHRPRSQTERLNLGVAQSSHAGDYGEHDVRQHRHLEQLDETSAGILKTLAHSPRKIPTTTPANRPHRILVEELIDGDRFTLFRSNRAQVQNGSARRQARCGNPAHAFASFQDRFFFGLAFRGARTLYSATRALGQARRAGNTRSGRRENPSPERHRSYRANLLLRRPRSWRYLCRAPS